VNKKRLDSWKAIAGFLSRSLRTVQRWHECNGLPVHHFGGHKGSVFAYEEEINHWLASLAEEPESAQVRADETLESGRLRSHELTVTANGLWETRSERNIQKIADLYRKAIDDDARNAAAFSGLANAMVLCALYDIVDGSMAYPSAIEALRRMPQLDSEYLDAKCPAAWIDMLYNRNWRQAHAGFEEVLSKRPSSFALAGLAAMHIAEGRIPEALKSGWEAWRLNPLVHSLGAFFCWIVYLSGDFQQALDMVAQIRSSGGDGNVLTTVEALVLMQEGSVQANLSRIEKAAADFPQNHMLQGILGYVYGVSGEKSKAWRKHAHLAHCSETNRKSNGYALAIVCMGLGDSQEVISWLETAYAEGSLWSLGFHSDPLLRIFKGDPRYVRLVSKIGVKAPYHAEAAYSRLVSHPFLESALAVENS
jgi:thioredoxin-like negative regulator of GroEL